MIVMSHTSDLIVRMSLFIESIIDLHVKMIFVNIICSMSALFRGYGKMFTFQDYLSRHPAFPLSY